MNISNGKKIINFIFTEIEKSIGSLKFASGSGLERQVRQKRSDFETTPGKISLLTKSWLILSFISFERFLAIVTT